MMLSDLNNPLIFSSSYTMSFLEFFSEVSP